VDRTRAGKLLLVEDEHVLRGLVAQFLRTDGYEVTEAADGQKALDAYSSSGPFDVVLLDLNLPILCGIEVCRRIKIENPSQSVLICSAAILDSDVELLRSLSVERLLTKPYHPLELLAGIEAAMRESSPASAGRVHASHSSGAGLHRKIGGSNRPANSEVSESQTLVK
jgi:DNA-binding response OmpR family regulator